MLLAAAAFAITCLAMSRFVPWPEEYGLRAKYEYFSAHKNEFDVAFFGSSRVFRAIDPRIVDAQLKSEGVEARSFNLGVGGMTSFECDFLFKEILALESQRLKVMVIEDQPWDPSSYFLGNTWSSRSIYWHTPAGTALALGSVFSADIPVTTRLDEAWTHVRLCGMKLTNIAQGPRIALDLLGMSKDPHQRALTPDQLDTAAGFQALDELVTAEFAAQWHDKLVAHKTEFDNIMGTIPGQNAKKPEMSRYSEVAIAEQNELARRAGTVLVRMIPPASEGHPEALELARRGDFEKLLDYNDPLRFPRYFQVDWRFDDHHLNRAGAEDLSRRVGTDLAPIVRAAH